MHRILLLALGLSLGLTGCSEAPARSQVEPVPLTMAAPTYAAATPDGLLLRSGAATRVVKDAQSASWLPDGRALVLSERGARVWDPATGDLGPRLPYLDPNRSVTQISAVGDDEWNVPVTLTAYDLDGREKWRTRLPLSDHPKASVQDEEVTRSYLSAHTIGGRTFLRWHDGSEWVEDGDYGVLVVGADGKAGENVQLNTPIIATWLAADGSALLATRRTRGKPCGGCQVPQELIELDPRTGETVATYELPEAYGKTWDVREVDKVGDQVVVRFEETVWGPEVDDSPTQDLVQRGTWVLDGDGWEMVPGSDEERSWWQGPDDRVIAVPLPPEEGQAGYRWRYVWEHDGKRTPLPGTSETTGGPPEGAYYTGSVPGQLIRP